MVSFLSFAERGNLSWRIQIYMGLLNLLSVHPDDCPLLHWLSHCTEVSAHLAKPP